MKKINICLVLIFLLVSICACGCNSTEAQSPAAATEAAETVQYVVHAHVPESWGTPSMWAWSEADGVDLYEAWPGTAMTASGDGWYEISLPGWVDSIVLSGNDGTIQTCDIVLDVTEFWIAVGEDLSLQSSLDGPFEVERYVTVSAVVPETWEDVRIWAWSDDKDAFESWPGEPMNRSGSWYTAEIPDWATYLIVNGNGGSVQTNDLPIDPGQDLWVVVSDSVGATVQYREPEKEQITELSHSWEGGSCLENPVCSVCGDKGARYPHEYEDHSCLSACSVCGWTEEVANHTLPDGEDAVSGICSVCNQYVEYFKQDGTVKAWTEYEIGAYGAYENPVTYLQSSAKSSGYYGIPWFREGVLLDYEIGDVIDANYGSNSGIRVNLSAFYASGKVYYFTNYSSENPEAVIRALSNAANQYISFYQATYSNWNYTSAILNDGGDWFGSAIKGYADCAMDAYGQPYAIVHKCPGSWDEADDPTQTWAVYCDWMQ